MQSKIKIVIIQSRLCVGGPAAHTEILAKYLNPAKFEVQLISGALETGELSRIDDLKHQGIHVTTLPEMEREISFWRDLRSVARLFRILKQERPHLVHTHTAKAGAVGRVAAWLAGVPVIIHTFHGHVFHSYFGKWKTWFFILLERVLAQITTAIIVISRSQQTDLVHRYRIARAEKIFLIPLGFELERFLKQKKHNYLKEALRVPAATPLLGIIGRLVPIKNHSLLLAVLQQFKLAGTPLHLAIVGDGELRPQLEQEVRNLGLEAWVSFLGWRLDTEFVYAGIDLLVLASLNEGTPVTIIEAMAAGVPVVATAVGGVPDLIRDAETGFLCAPNHVGEMLVRIQYVLQHHELSLSVIENARKSAFQHYSQHRLKQEMERFYSRWFTTNTL
ncbi:glycosyltransferase family 4 protein [candidate division KSB1 bacterium]|nr:glycosyltransferase family 4 protein [candidate division KSB1 bacterium]